ncbi:hypothetical protein KI688_003716 [Linnemannia hyalina]|uniref:MTHFR SAM-binding regulatory domain-containing protein n=1 Tax=Linnemannia hyalina TaxID=64524 RepID=A0A9P8BR12_9FUNG|nr:hypothetical protein KI688_003716 [Linnemannia hyalina]
MNSKQKKYFAKSDEIELKQWGALADVSHPDDLDIIWTSIAMNLLKNSSRQRNREARNRLRRLSTYDRMRIWEQLHESAATVEVAWKLPGNSSRCAIDAEAFSGYILFIIQDEAFELWSEWPKIYEPSRESVKVIDSIRDEWHLINIVHNVFQDQELESVKTINSVASAATTNGQHEGPLC